MKLLKLTKYLLFSLIVLGSACKKYGVDVQDGYSDDSGNVAGGVVDVNSPLVDKSMYAQARIFPGLVGDSEKRTGQNGEPDGKFTLNLNFAEQTKETLRFSTAPTAMLSTGYYAAPGELVKIIVPAGIDGLSVQIGVHTVDASAFPTPKRYPVIFTRKQLYSGENYVRNLFGGNIYIMATRSYKASALSTEPYPVEFTITNACKTPDFVLGEDTDAAWFAKVRASTVPWLELRSEHVIWTVQRDLILQKMTALRDPLTNPTALMTEWNDIFDQHFDKWMGLTKDAPELVDRVPQSPWRATYDINLRPGAAGIAGFPFMALGGYAGDEWFQTWTSLNQLRTNQPKPNWGTYHELGHNTQQTYYVNGQGYRIWEWENLGEATNNLFSYKVAKAYGQDFKILHPPNTWNNDALAFVAKTTTRNFDLDLSSGVETGSFARTVPFVQLLERYGYEWFTALHKQGRRITRPNINEQSRKDYFFEFISNYNKINMLPFFNAWGIQVSVPSQNEIASKNYPLLTEQVWNYNIMERIGALSVSSQEPVTATSPTAAVNLTNGNDTDFWSSQTTGTLPATANYPFNLVFYVGSPTQNIATIKGVRITQRANAATYVNTVDVEVSNDNITYTAAGTMQVPQNTTPYQFIFPAGAKQAKYMKLIIRTGTATRSASLAEVRAIY